MLLFKVMQCYNYLMEYFTKKSQLCSIMSKQPIDLSLVKSEILSKTSLPCVTPNNQTH